MSEIIGHLLLNKIPIPIAFKAGAVDNTAVASNFLRSAIITSALEHGIQHQHATTYQTTGLRLFQ